MAAIVALKAEDVQEWQVVDLAQDGLELFEAEALVDLVATALDDAEDFLVKLLFYNFRRDDCHILLLLRDIHLR